MKRGEERKKIGMGEGGCERERRREERGCQGIKKGGRKKGRRVPHQAIGYTNQEESYKKKGGG